MTPTAIETEMSQARAQLAQLGRHPRGRDLTRSNALMRRLLALWAWKLNRDAQQARREQ